MPISLKSQAKRSARRQIDIRGVRDDVLLLSKNRYRAVLEVSPINFELQSEQEQDAITDTYESFLNSVGHPIQIIVRTRELDLDDYLARQALRLQNETQEVYRSQLANYQDFIRSLVQKNKVLSRRFYLVVPFDSEPRIEFDSVHEQLMARVENITRGLARLGMHTQTLRNLDILNLFYEFYSAEQAKLQPLSTRALSQIHEAFITKEVV